MVKTTSPATTIRNLGILRIVRPRAKSLLPQFTGLTDSVFFSSVGPYQPKLLELKKFAGERRMIDGYLRIHANLAKAGFASAVMVRDYLASATKISASRGYPSHSDVESLVNDIEKYCFDFVSQECGGKVSSSLFRVLRESSYINFNNVEFLRELAEYDLSAKSKLIRTLDVRTGLDFVHIQKGGPVAAIVNAGSAHWGAKHATVLLEWEGMVKAWKSVGISPAVTIAEVPTFKGPRDTRRLYKASLDKLGSLKKAKARPK
jgi:hypothetical protein